MTNMDRSPVFTQLSTSVRMRESIFFRMVRGSGGQAGAARGVAPTGAGAAAAGARGAEKLPLDETPTYPMRERTDIATGESAAEAKPGDASKDGARTAVRARAGLRVCWCAELQAVERRD